jgi:hypothetical protein
VPHHWEYKYPIGGVGWYACVSSFGNLIKVLPRIASKLKKKKKKKKKKGLIAGGRLILLLLRKVE